MVRALGVGVALFFVREGLGEAESDGEAEADGEGDAERDGEADGEKDADATGWAGVVTVPAALSSPLPSV